MAICEQFVMYGLAKQSDDLKRKLIAWVVGDDMGMSSRTLWTVIMGYPVDKHPEIPYDPDDFGRCYRLLKLVPKSQHKKILKAAAKAYPKWKSFARDWDKMTELWEMEIGGEDAQVCAPKLYAAMQKCVREAEHER